MVGLSTVRFVGWLPMFSLGGYGCLVTARWQAGSLDVVPLDD